MLWISEKNALRKIYGGKKGDGKWQRRTLCELEELFAEPNMVQGVKTKMFGARD